MLPVLEQLLVIQDRDRRIAQLRVQLGRIPQQIAAVEARQKAEAVHVEELRQQLRHLETERKKLEVDAESKRTQILKYRTQLFQIKSNTEYQALLKEISGMEKGVKAVEDEELGFMEQSEQIQPSLKEAQALWQELTAKAQSEKDDLERQAGVVQEELAQLQTDRDKLAEQAAGDALARYERLMHSKGDMAVAPVRNGNCGGCHLHLAPQLLHNAKRGDELTSCDYCGRILYWQPE